MTAASALARRLRLGEPRLDLLAELGQEMAHGGEQQLVLAAEIMVRQRRGDAGAAGDLAHRHLAHAAVVDGVDRRRDQRLAAHRLHSDPRHQSTSRFELFAYRFLIDRSIKISLPGFRIDVSMGSDARLPAVGQGRGQQIQVRGRLSMQVFMKGCALAALAVVVYGGFRGRAGSGEL